GKTGIDGYVFFYCGLAVRRISWSSSSWEPAPSAAGQAQREGQAQRGVREGAEEVLGRGEGDLALGEVANLDEGDRGLQNSSPRADTRTACQEWPDAPAPGPAGTTRLP